MFTDDEMRLMASYLAIIGMIPEADQGLPEVLKAEEYHTFINKVFYPATMLLGGMTEEEKVSLLHRIREKLNVKNN